MQSATGTISPQEIRDPFQTRYDSLPLPLELRKEAEGMDWSLFRTIYCPDPSLLISGIEHTTLPDGSARIGAQVVRYSKTQPPRTTFHQTIASGPAAACTEILAECGWPVEMLSFHQMPLFEATVTFIKAHHHTRTKWAMGFGATPAASIAHALSCAATRLHG